jgi:arylsulfatase A-like enzyme
MRELCHDDEIIEVIKPHDMLPRTTDYAVNYIHQKAKESKEGKPFFLYMAFGSPHVPHLPTKEWIGKSGLGKYGDFVMMTDGMVGRIVDALHQHDIADDTIIIFSADNGTSKAANFEKLKEHGHHPSAHFRGCKTDYWEGAHRVPFVVRWPNGGIEGGEVCHDLIGLTDLYATIADLIGYTLPDYEAEDSLSFLASISNTKKNHLRENIIHHSGGGHFSIRKGKWKLLLSPGSGGLSMPNDKSAHRQGLAHIQLYNLEQDIRETTNLQAQYPEIVASLIELLKKQIRDGRSTTGSKQDNDFKNINIWKKSYIK